MCIITVHDFTCAAASTDGFQPRNAHLFRHKEALQDLELPGYAQGRLARVWLPWLRLKLGKTKKNSHLNREKSGTV
jgi:hypothetical protein